jgi:hypothetical protein
VPTLLFRKETESLEGLGGNVVLSKFDDELIFKFIERPEQYRRMPVFGDVFPSEKIVQKICALQILE